MMKITEELANEIMEGLFHLALSAYGNTESEWALNTAMNYALETFEKLMNDWEKGLGMEWEIIKTEPTASHTNKETMWVMDEKTHRYLTFPKEKGTSVKHGYWIDKGDYAICSECGTNSGTQYNGLEPTPYYSKFCHNCGAKMDEVEDGAK